MYPAGIPRNLLEHGYPGEVYPVNPNRDSVFGFPCYPDVTQTPEPADLAALTIPRRSVLWIFEQCLKAAIPAALVIAAGFAQGDEEGRRLQSDMICLVDGTPLPVVGPNSAGFANVPDHVIATRLSVAPRPGGVSFVSQSGALMMAVCGLLADRCTGMNLLLSVGNQVDVTLSEAITYLANNQETTVIAAFVQGVAEGRLFVEGLRRALVASKPVVLVKSGRTAPGQRAASTHTAAVPWSDRTFEAVCHQFGALVAEDVRKMLDATQVLDAFGAQLADSVNVAVVSQSGGMGSLAGDLAELFRLRLPPLSGPMVAQLRALPHIANTSALGNPADVQGASFVGPAAAETLEPYLADPRTDVVLVLLARPAVQERDAATAKAIIAAHEAYDKPLMVVWLGQRYPVKQTEWPLAHRMLAEAGMP